jgi:hypothetical protein
MATKSAPLPNDPFAPLWIRLEPRRGMMPAGLNGLQELLRETARSVLEEVGPALVETLAPRIAEALPQLEAWRR